MHAPDAYAYERVQDGSLNYFVQRAQMELSSLSPMQNEASALQVFN